MLLTENQIQNVQKFIFFEGEFIDGCVLHPDTMLIVDNQFFAMPAMGKCNDIRIIDNEQYAVNGFKRSLKQLVGLKKSIPEKEKLFGEYIKRLIIISDYIINNGSENYIYDNLIYYKQGKLLLHNMTEVEVLVSVIIETSEEKIENIALKISKPNKIQYTSDEVIESLSLVKEIKHLLE